MKLIKNAKIVMPGGIEEGNLLFSDKIVEVLLDNSINKINEGELEVIDGDDCYLTPGFIDIHIHGAAGYDTMDASGKALNGISRALLKSGVTSFLATTMSMPVENIKAALEVIKEVAKYGTEGARVLGCHLEGPYLNKNYKGAQAEEDIIPPDLEIIKDYTDIIKIVTMAPEKKSAEELIKYLKASNIVISIGHSEASYEEVMKARNLGLSHATHLFNAMVGLHHRKPGIIGTILSTDMTCDLIADFIHIHPAVLSIVLKVKGADKIILITDQMMAGSMDEGEYDLGGQRVIVKDGAARLENGQLAGSILTMDQAVRNINKISDLSVEEIIRMATYNPACLLGKENEIGSIKKGLRADLVLMDKELRIKKVYVGGKLMN